MYSGDFFFSCNSNYGYWNGITVSKTTSNTFAGLDDQYNSITGGGCDGSKAFAIAYYSEYDANNSNQYPEIMEFYKGAPFYPEYVYVTNAAYAVNSMESGDTYAKKFHENDYLKGIFKGMAIDWDKEQVELVETGTQVEFYLAKDGKRYDMMGRIIKQTLHYNSSPPYTAQHPTTRDAALFSQGNDMSHYLNPESPLGQL